MEFKQWTRKRHFNLEDSSNHVRVVNLVAILKQDWWCHKSVIHRQNKKGKMLLALLLQSNAQTCDNGK